MPGWSTSSSERQEGDEATLTHDQHLSEQQEIELLAPFATKAQAGGMLHVNKIKQALEQW